MLSLLGPDDGGFLFAHLFLRQLPAAVRAVLANSPLLPAKDYRSLAEEADRILLASRTFNFHALATDSPGGAFPASTCLPRSIRPLADGRDCYTPAPRKEHLFLPSAFWRQSASLPAALRFHSPGKQTRQRARFALRFGMDSKPKRAKQKSSVRPCPQGCGFCLHDSDQHDACPVCLGIVHARRALTEPEACAFCRQLRRSTLERRVTFVEKVLGRSAVARHDPLLSESGAPASSESEDEDFPVDVPAISWADHMEYVDGLADDEPEPCRSADGLQPGLKPASAPQEDDDVLDIGLDIHEFTTDIQHVAGKSNHVTDCLSRVLVSPVYVGIDYAAMAAKQRADPDILALKSTKTGLVLEDTPVWDGGPHLLCDVSTGRPRPVVPLSWRRRVFDSVHALSHPGVRASVKLVSARHDAHRTPLRPPYDGPYRVLKPGNKHFILDFGGRQEVVSVDRLKTAHVMHEDQVVPDQAPRRGRPPATGLMDSVFSPRSDPQSTESESSAAFSEE
ncbi:unnamed protein product [Oreochromis niloticus]|nr:unnamed protein product [Mustela putorius furo]